MPPRLLPATVQLSEQLARQSDPIAVIDALNRIAHSRSLGGAAVAWPLAARAQQAGKAADHRFLTMQDKLPMQPPNRLRQESPA